MTLVSRTISYDARVAQRAPALRQTKTIKGGIQSIISKSHYNEAGMSALCHGSPSRAHIRVCQILPEGRQRSLGSLLHSAQRDLVFHLRLYCTLPVFPFLVAMVLIGCS